MASRSLLLIALTLALVMALSGVPAASWPDADTTRCQKLQRDISRARARLRQRPGWREAERHRARMQRLKTRYYRHCRPADR